MYHGITYHQYFYILLSIFIYLKKVQWYYHRIVIVSVL